MNEPYGVSRRWLPERPLPPYTYVPGRTPHPVSDPAGHSYSAHIADDALPAEARCLPHGPCPDDNSWRHCEPYLWGLDLFNHGFYWEAHEAWEEVWLACGRRGPTAALVKGLIKLAAAAVKAREGNARGLRRHARRAAELLTSAAAQEKEMFLGVRPTELAAAAHRIAHDADSLVEQSTTLVGPLEWMVRP